MDPSRSLTDRAIGFIYAQADIALVSVAIAASYGLGSAIVGSGTAAASTTLLAEAQRIGSSTVTQVREHVLWRHADLLGITIKGNMQDSSNPMVQTALERINSISNAPERIIANTFKGREVFEYIASGIGVVRDRTTGEVVTILSRDAAGLQKLQGFVDNGTAKWLK